MPPPSSLPDDHSSSSSLMMPFDATSAPGPRRSNRKVSLIVDPLTAPAPGATGGSASGGGAGGGGGQKEIVSAHPASTANLYVGTTREACSKEAGACMDNWSTPNLCTRLPHRLHKSSSTSWLHSKTKPWTSCVFTSRLLLSCKLSTSTTVVSSRQAMNLIAKQTEPSTPQASNRTAVPACQSFNAAERHADASTTSPGRSPRQTPGWMWEHGTFFSKRRSARI